MTFRPPHPIPIPIPSPIPIPGSLSYLVEEVWQAVCSSFVCNGKEEMCCPHWSLRDSPGSEVTLVSTAFEVMALRDHHFFIAPSDVIAPGLRLYLTGF